MRNTFAKRLAELAEKDERICLLTGDLGYMALEPFSERFPQRFFNMGVAEQNMVGTAAGLAEAGFLPFVYSIVTFATLRPYEFIRNAAILHNLPVRIVGVGGGVEYGHNGPTHYGLEDVGVMRVQPGISVIAPADARQTKSALDATYALAGPVYYRLGKDDRAEVAGLDGRFELGRAQMVREGNDVLVISMGSIGTEAAHACEMLAKDGISAAHMVVASIAPAPVEDIAAIAAKFKTVMTVEAHYSVGGLGSLVSEVVAERQLDCRVIRNAIHTAPDGRSGSQEYLYKKWGISANCLVEKASAAVAGARQQ